MPPLDQPTRALLGLALAWALLAPASGGAAPPERRPGEPFLLREPTKAPQARAASLSPFQPVGVTSRLRRANLQFDALVTDQAWDEAIDLLTQLENEAGDELVAAPDEPALDALVTDAAGHQRYTPLAERLQQMLAGLPAEGLEAYRDRVERSAQEDVNQGIVSLDEAALAKAVREAYASAAAGEASLALAELALERGDTAAARRWLTPLDRLARGPFGRPAGVSLGLLDPKVDAARLAAAWSEAERPGSPLAGAHDDLTPTVLARLALISLREGDLRRAAGEARLLRGLAPDATGRFAGREQPLADALDTLLSSPNPITRDTAPSADYAWAWTRATPYEPIAPPPANRFSGALQIRLNAAGQRQIVRVPATTTSVLDRRSSLQAVAAGEAAFYVEQGVVKRLDLASGVATTFPLPGVETSTPPASPGPAHNDLTVRRFDLGVVQGQFVQFGGKRPTPAVSPTRIDPRLAYSGGLLFARVVEAPNRGRAARGAVRTVRETLLGVDPNRAQEAVVRVVLSGEVAARNTGRWEFGGPPTVRGDRLYISLVRPGVRTKVAVACYSTGSSRELWRTELGAGEPRLRIGSSSTSAVTVAGDTVYLATGLGAVAALDAANGSQRWIALYPRDATAGASGRFTEPPRRCFVVGDRVIATPNDSTRLFAWDAATGRPLWDGPRNEEDRLVGVVDAPSGSIVVLAGRRLAGFDSLTGGRRFVWPESERAGLRGRGDAAIAGGEVFWPTRTELIVFDPVRGGLSRSPIGLHPVGASGANLLTTDLGLLVAGPKKIRLLASREPIPTEPAAPTPRLSHEAVSPSGTLATHP